MEFPDIEHVNVINHNIVINWASPALQNTSPLDEIPEITELDKLQTFYTKFIDKIADVVSKTYITCIEGEITRLRHYLPYEQIVKICVTQSL